MGCVFNLKSFNWGKLKMIKVIKLTADSAGEPIEKQIEEEIKNQNITKENLIDIKFSQYGLVSHALIIYEG